MRFLSASYIPNVEKNVNPGKFYNLILEDCKGYGQPHDARGQTDRINC